MVSEQKFKVGDRVKLAPGKAGYDLLDGTAYTVMSIARPTDIGQWVKLEGKSNARSFDESYLSSLFELVPAWQPKVGDRVRYRDEYVSGEGVIHSRSDGDHFDWLVKVDGKDRSWAYNVDGCRHFTTSTLTPVAPTALTIEAGKFYKTRDGRKVGPMYVYEEAEDPAYSEIDDSNGRMWKPNGTRYYGGNEETDLVALWEEPFAVGAKAAIDNAAPASQPKFKVGDRVRSRSVGEAGIGVVIDLDPFQVDYRDTWFRVCSENPISIELVAPTTATPAIVALIEDGQPKPATKPKVHADQAAATAEASRLALEFPGQQFGVFVLADSKIADIVQVPTAVLRAA